MSIRILSSRRPILHRLLQPTPILRRLSAESDIPAAPPGNETNEESLANQVLQHLVGTPDTGWVSSQTLDSLLFSSLFSAPSPRFLSQITHRLKSYPLALSFFNYLHHNSQHLKSRDECLSSAFQSVLELASLELDSKNKLIELYKASKEKNVPLTVNAIKLLIRFFGRAELVYQSILVYEELNPGMKNTHVRNVLIDVLLRAGRVDDAFKVLDEMLQRESEFLPNDITGNIVFHALLRRDPKGRLVTDEEIVGLVKKFGDHGVFPNSIWLTRFITRLCKNDGTCQAWRVLDYLMKQKAPLEASAINALLSGLAWRRDVSRMNALLMKMKEADIRPNVVTFGILINCLCKSRRVDEALEVFKSMRVEENGNKIMVEADVITYNTLIDGLCKVGRVKEGEELMKKMKTDKGCTPTTVTYNCLIDGFCRAGDIKKAQWLFDQMIDERINPNVITLNTIVGGMCRHWGVSSAVQYFRDKQKVGLKGNAVTYTMLIDAFCNVNNTEKAMDWFNEMLASGCAPDAMVYYTLISGMCLARRADDAMKVVSKLKEAGFSLDLVAYNMLIALFSDTKRVDWVQELLTDMEESGVKPDTVTYNTLISFFGRNKDFKSAHRTMRRMVKDGFVPNVLTYGAMISAYCSKGAIGEAMKLFKDMGSRSEVMPNTVIYNILIESLCKNKNVDEAVPLMDDMRQKGVKPNTNTYNAMFKGTRDQNRLDKAFKLMDKMIEDTCVPDYITMEILTEWFSEVGETERLRRFVQLCEVSAPSYKLGTLSS